MNPVLGMMALALALGLGSTPAAAQLDDMWRAGARVQAEGTGQPNLWAAGAIVAVSGTVQDQIRVAGAEVNVSARSGGDTWAAGAIVTVEGEAAGNLYAAGARVSVNSIVAGKLSVAGARVLIGPGTEVTGDTRVAGADVVFTGTSRGPAEFYGDSVQILGRIMGDVHVRARHVSVGNEAVIDGNVVFETLNDPDIAVGAIVRGEQTVTNRMPYRFDHRSMIFGLVAAVLLGVGAGFVLGLILLIAARPFVERAIDAMRTTPLWTGLVGLGVLILVPLVASLIMITVVGIPIGLLLLLAFPFAVVTGLVLSAYGLSDRLLNKERAQPSFLGRLLLLLVGLLVLAVIGLIPVLGFVVGVLALLIGLGAVWQAMRNRTNTPSRAAEPEPVSDLGGN